MSYKYVAIQEETTYRTESAVGYKYLRLLDESLVTSREDFFPDTTEYWSQASKSEGYFRTSGTVNVPLDPVIFPWVLVMGLGDPHTENVSANGTYRHLFRFGANEVIAATGIKPFTTKIGVGVEKDRQLHGCYVNSLAFDCVSRELATCAIGVTGSGQESLAAAADPTTGWSLYTKPLLTFNSTQAATVGNTFDTDLITADGTDRLTTAPEIEAFRLTLDRSYDSDYYPLGSRYIGSPIPSGMVSATGSMDFNFSSQDEHERFLAAVNSYTTGDQASFGVDIKLRGPVVGGSFYYYIEFILPKTYYTVSTPSVKARDRIMQTVDFRTVYDSTTACSAAIAINNITASYA